MKQTQEALERMKIAQALIFDQNLPNMTPLQYIVDGSLTIGYDIFKQ